MNKLKYFLFICFLWLNLNAQDSKLSSITLAVVLPSNIDGLTESDLSKLESKIIEAVTNNGISADGYTQNFVIYPKFEIYGQKESKGGMRNITVVNCNLSLFIKQLSSNIIFSTYSKTIQGSGFNKNEAINNAIELIDPAEPKINDFIKNGRDKIVNYYQSNCETVLKKAETEKNINNYECALAILLTVPEEATNCYAKAQERAKVAFKDFQKSKCNLFIQNAKTSSAAGNYGQALEYLSCIDPQGPCGSESKNLIASIALKVDNERKQELDFLYRAYRDAVSLKKAQISAMNNLAISWLRSQPNNATYITVIK